MQFTQVLQATGLQEALAARMNIDNLINDLTNALYQLKSLYGLLLDRKQKRSTPTQRSKVDKP